jgi:hypothetical protein
MSEITADHGWRKSSTVAEGYIENFLKNKKETSKKIKEGKENIPNVIISDINNCTNLTINVNLEKFTE